MTSSPRAKRIARIVKRPPVFRPLLEDDWPVLAVAFERGAFPELEGLPVEQLREHLERQGKELTAVEDVNPQFRAGRGIVALILVRFDGWTLEPELALFPWATRFNLLRGVVAFLRQMKRSSVVGVCVVRTKQSSHKFMERVAELKLLFRCGYIPQGYPDSPMWLFNISGKKRKAVSDAI